jgi:hypothetical protein
MSRDDEHGHRLARAAAEGPLISMKTQRKIAKAGVLASMGVLIWTGMQPRRRYLQLHIWAGMALLGVTLWHWSLYQPKADKRPQPGPARGAGRPAPVPPPG